MSEQKFNISIDRVDKIPIPLLVVGLGGTGCNVLQAIKQTFAERYNLPKAKNGSDLPAPPRTAYLTFDSLSVRPEGLDINEYVDISLPGVDKILGNQSELLTSFEHTWVNRKLKHSSNGLGMGTVRQAARLAVSRNYAKIREALVGALRNIVSVQAGSSDTPKQSMIEIVIATGIGGGTGSGIFLDMAQIIRDAAKEVAPTIPATVTGYIVMPDVSLVNVSAASGMAAPIKHNAYAALKELDFWMRVKQHETRYIMQYGDSNKQIEWKEPPFDHCILMSCSNVNGVPYKNGYAAVCSTIAENLMHYLAKEDGTSNQYSYRQYEDNLTAIKAGLKKNYPLNYAYRAIGAFTKRIPKKPILYYEGSKLLATFIPLRDDEGRLQPDSRMFTDGQGQKRVDEITGVGKQLMQDFRTNCCKLPSFCNTDLNDNVKVTAVQSLNPAPHSRWHNWRDQVCAPAALKASETYLSQGWERFVKFAERIICDPEQGPFALLKYLEAENGLISGMKATLVNWEKKRNEVRTQQIKQGEELCVNAWPHFCKPPILGKRAALEQYDHAIKTLYTYVANSEFLEKHTEALRKLILRVEEYLRDGLKPLCQSVLFLEEEFGKTDDTDEKLVRDIYSLDDVRENIDHSFKAANENNKLSCEFLRSLCDISVLAEPSVDAKTSGVQFLCRNVGLMNMCDVLQDKMQENFGDVNNQSLDSIMVANVGDDIAAQQAWMQNLGDEVLNSALPMFQQDPVFAHEVKAPYSYMSIPEDATEHLKYIKTAFATHDPAVEPKASSLKDHMYCLMAWDGLPLYRYSMMEDLRQAYAEDLDKDGFEGMHLVRTGESEADYSHDWSLLPSPKPYFLFSRSSVAVEVQAYEKVHSLVERAKECGMLKVNTDNPNASAELKMMYSQNGIALMTTESMISRLNTIMNEKNPATGAAYTKSELKARVRAYADEAKTRVLEENSVKPVNVANVLGIEKEPCDPFAENIQGDETALKCAKENHKKLCTVIIETLVYTDPAVERAIEMQIEAFEKIAEILRETEPITIWQPRINYGESFADMLVFMNDSVFLGGQGYKYKNKTGKYDIVNPALMKEDLKDVESALVQAVAFLADTDDSNSAKADLTTMLTKALRDYNNAIDDETMTADDMQALIDAANEVIEDAESEITEMEHQKREQPELAEILGFQIDLLKQMQTTAKLRLKNFKKLIKGLD